MGGRVNGKRNPDLLTLTSVTRMRGGAPETLFASGSGGLPAPRAAEWLDKYFPRHANSSIRRRLCEYACSSGSGRRRPGSPLAPRKNQHRPDCCDAHSESASGQGRPSRPGPWHDRSTPGTGSSLRPPGRTRIRFFQIPPRQTDWTMSSGWRARCRRHPRARGGGQCQARSPGSAIPGSGWPPARLGS